MPALLVQVSNREACATHPSMIHGEVPFPKVTANRHVLRMPESLVEAQMLYLSTSVHLSLVALSTMITEVNGSTKAAGANQPKDVLCPNPSTTINTAMWSIVSMLEHSKALPTVVLSMASSVGAATTSLMAA